MNFKSLALSSVIAVSSIFGTVSGAEAKPTTCWFEDQTTPISAINCNITKMYHDGSIFDWVGTYFLINELEALIYLKDNGTFIAEPLNGDPEEYGTWRYDHEGDIQMKMGGTYFTFRV